jgi:hypothetical protein
MNGNIEKQIGELFNKVDKAFEESDIRKYAEEKGKKWHYSIVSTAVQPNCPLLVGLNWGADKVSDYEKQNSIPKEKFFEIPDLGSFRRIRPFLESYFPGDSDNLVQSNFFFFRSENESQISQKDLNISSELFSEFLKIVEPSTIIGFSSKLRDYFLTNKDIFDLEHTVPITTNKGVYNVYIGRYIAGGVNVPVFLLPHPNYRISGEARHQAWKSCFGS